MSTSLKIAIAIALFIYITLSIAIASLFMPVGVAMLGCLLTAIPCSPLIFFLARFLDKILVSRFFNSVASSHETIISIKQEKEDLRIELEGLMGKMNTIFEEEMHTETKLNFLKQEREDINKVLSKKEVGFDHQEISEIIDKLIDKTNAHIKFIKTDKTSALRYSNNQLLIDLNGERISIKSDNEKLKQMKENERPNRMEKIIKAINYTRVEAKEIKIELEKLKDKYTSTTNTNRTLFFKPLKNNYINANKIYFIKQEEIELQPLPNCNATPNLRYK